MNPLLAKLREQRDALKNTINGITETVAAENRDALSDAEQHNFDTAIEQVRALDERITQLVEVEERNAKAAEMMARVDATPVATVTRTEAIYRPDVQERSYFRDLALAEQKDSAAIERLTRNNAHVAAEVRTTATSGLAGFVPPAYLVNEYAKLARASRPTANLVRSMGAPTTNVFYIPKVSSGLSTGFQSAENASVTSADLSATNVQVTARTLAGYTDVSQQLLDYGQLPDNIIFGDLAASLATQIETMVLDSTTSNNEGILHVTNALAVTYTDASPTVGELYGQIGYAVSQIHANRYAMPEVIIMDPVMASWIKSRTDSTGRPLVTPVAPQNAVATFGNLGAEGIQFELFGLPVCVSSSVPMVSEATPTKRQVIVARISDSMLWETAPVAEVFNDGTLSTTLTVRFRVRANVAQTHARQPKSIAVISGTGTAISSASF